MMTIVMIALAVLAALEIAGLILIVKLMDKYTDLKDTEEFMKNILKINNDNVEINTRALMKIFDREDSMYKLVSAIDTQYDMMKDAFEAMTDALKDEYTRSNEHQDKLIELWGEIEAHYSDCYDQYMKTRSDFKQFLSKWEDIGESNMDIKSAVDIVCLECPEENCRCEECPVYILAEKLAKNDRND